jgi:hypothetical protein
VPDLHGDETTSADFLVSYRDWLLARARRSGRRVINASAAGILFGDGVTQASLADLAAKWPSRSLPAVATLARRLTMPQPPSAADLGALCEALASNHTANAVIAQWQDFSGDGFDPAAVRAALEAGNAPPATRPGSDSGTLWARCLLDPGARQVFRELPEAMTRFRAVLNGTVPRDSDEASALPARRQALEQALRLLPRILEAIARDDATHLFGVTERDLMAPVTAQFHWKDDELWAVATFEALLGQAWRGGEPAAAHHDFDRPARRREDLAAHDGIVHVSTRAQAARLLVFEWLRCAASLQAAETPSGDPIVPEQFAPFLRAREVAARDGGDAVLTIDGSGIEAIRIPIGLSESALARTLSESSRPAGAAPAVSAHIELDDVRVDIRLLVSPDRHEPALPDVLDDAAR